MHCQAENQQESKANKQKMNGEAPKRVKTFFYDKFRLRCVCVCVFGHVCGLFVLECGGRGNGKNKKNTHTHYITTKGRKKKTKTKG